MFQLIRDKLLAFFRRWSEDPRQALWVFTRGGFLFVAGTLIILLVNHRLAPSLAQELLAAFGLLMVVLGCVSALWGYLCLSVFKILVYLLDKKDTNNERR